MTTSLSLTPVEMGAGVGAALGLGASFLMFRKPSTTELIGATLLGAVAGAVVAKAAAPAAALTGTPVNLTVSPPGTYAITPTMGQTVNFALPAGGSWTSVLGTPNGYGPTITADQLENGTPVSFVYAGPGTVTVTWTDANGAAQTTTFSLTTSTV